MTRAEYRHPIPLDLREYIEGRLPSFVDVEQLVEHCRDCSGCRIVLWRLCDNDDERVRVFGMIDAGGRR